ncbi:MAG: hypothetical protein FJW14_00640 [Acidimicrobiia bacterium]|nr:hypothetical protein [Acidimicrobiia bacterium]
MRFVCAPALAPFVLALGTATAAAQQTPLTVAPTGNVGIGTAAPAHKLDVQGGEINASGGLCIAGDCKTSWSQVTFGPGLTLTGGNLGVGTTTPAYRLDVQGGQINASGGLCIAGDCKTSWSRSVTGSLRRGDSPSGHQQQLAVLFERRRTGLMTLRPGR